MFICSERSRYSRAIKSVPTDFIPMVVECQALMKYIGFCREIRKRQVTENDMCALNVPVDLWLLPRQCAWFSPKVIEEFKS